MFIIRIFIILFTFLLGSSTLQAQSFDSAMARRIVNDMMANGMAYKNLRDLCQIGHRLSGSENAAKAVSLTMNMLQEAGADTVYLQPCMVPKWERGQEATGYIQSGEKERRDIRMTSLGNAVGTNGQVVCADIIEIKDFNDLYRLGEKAIKGKIVFFNLAMDPTHIRTFRAYGESGIARRIGPAQAAKYGAVGVWVRSLASNVDAYPHTGTTKYNDSFPAIPAVAISTLDAEWISNRLTTEKSLRACFRSNARMMGDVLSYNVIGEIRGTEFPGEIITVGGHLDSWDLGEGAHDDGAGCVQSIDMIRAFKKLGIRPKRTVRAVMFMNEENGGKGADAYLDSAKARKEQHIFALESDAGGFSPRGFSLDMASSSYEKVLRWKQLFAEYGVYDFFRGGSGSDIGPLKEIGTALAGLIPDSQRYFDVHHAATDVFETVSQRELHLGAGAMAVLAWLVSEYGL